MSTCLVSKLKASVNNSDLPYLSFCDTTKALLTAYSVSIDESNPMQKALDSFVRTLVNANIWGNNKIAALCLPFITNLSESPNIDDAVKDCINTSRDFFSTSNRENIQLYHNGIKALRNGGSRISIVTTKLYTADDFHLAAYILEDEPIERPYSPTTFAEKPVFIGQPIVGLYVNNQSFKMTGTNIANSGNDFAFKSCMRIATRKVGVNDGKGVLYTNGNPTLTPNDSMQSSTVVWLGFARNDSTYLPTPEPESYDNTKGQLFSPVGIMSVGGYLTSEEATLYTNAANKLVQAIHQYMEE